MSFRSSIKCCIGDLGLSQPASETSFNNEIYGVIPYVAPEIFNGAVFTKASDVYSLGMIMWECTTGCKPFADVEHDHTLIYKILNGKRPEITKDTPECYANLMKRCWELDPTKRPSIHEVGITLSNWDYLYNEYTVQFKQAEKKRPLSPFISKVSSINSTSSLSFNEYISKEYELDINIQSSTIGSSHSGGIYTSRPLSALISTVNESRKHKIEELDIEIQDSGK
ncbi:kinase-like domain-containing protein [Glomus cerebriforme]|uniref:Kinase-like domain-containing protein n=1 Tax=Glomus cerebriforme TaxID=658196 RepID=A0A397TB73_9GLOM|nr:kinase-like domain-containing protein [Glomus cerebriforme]